MLRSSSLLARYGPSLARNEHGLAHHRICCRDQEEKSRHTEIELHDREVQQYAQLRMRTEKQRPGGGLAAGSLGVAKKIDKEKSRCPQLGSCCPVTAVLEVPLLQSAVHANGD
jgi:hypothetical protein